MGLNCESISTTSTKYNVVLLYTISSLGKLFFLEEPDNVSINFISSKFINIPVSLTAVSRKFSPKSWYPPGNPQLLWSVLSYNKIFHNSFLIIITAPGWIKGIWLTLLSRAIINKIG